MGFLTIKISTLVAASVLSCSTVAMAAGDQDNSLTAQLREEVVPVTIDSFVRAETAAQIDRMLMVTGGLNKLTHFYEPTPLDQQSVIRMNRDTLYSFGVFDISGGATLTIPDTGARYVSATIVNEDHFINEVFYGGGEFELNTEKFDTPYVVVVLRTLIDASDPADVAEANGLQDKVTVATNSAIPYQHSNYDEESYEAIYELALRLGEFTTDSTRTFGTKETTHGLRHFLGTAFGWGGLPEQDAFYLNVTPNLPIGEYVVNISDVPVDAFWSVSIYNEDGYFQENDRNSYIVNNISNDANADGSYTIHFGGCDDDRINCLPLTEGWNYVVRLYRPDQSIIDGSWQFPAAEKLN